MSDTFSKIYIQIVFAVARRECLIENSWETELHKYISGIVKNQNQKMIIINGMPDHIHLFIGMLPSCCLSDLVREIKKSSNDFINENRFTKHKFNWQEGYGAFSYSASHIDNVYQYIMNQKSHHKKQTFKDEYIELLKKFQIEFKEEHLFKWIL